MPITAGLNGVLSLFTGTKFPSPFQENAGISTVCPEASEMPSILAAVSLRITADESARVSKFLPCNNLISYVFKKSLSAPNRYATSGSLVLAVFFIFIAWIDFHSPGTLDVTDTLLTLGILAISDFTASKLVLAFLVFTSITTKRFLLNPRSVWFRYFTCIKSTIVAMIMTTETVN